MGRAAAIELMEDLSEVVRYDREGVRLHIHTTELSSYPDMRAPLHWHDDLECIHVLDGAMGYSVSGQESSLKAGDSLLINTRQMHYGYGLQGRECRFTCIRFHPSLFTGSEALLRREITPILEHPGLLYWHFSRETGFGRDAAELLEQIARLSGGGVKDYELEVVGLLHVLWGRLRRQIGELPPLPNSPYTDLELQRDMVSFIYQNYGRKLALAEIAAAGHVSRSKCCQLFHRQTPNAFLNAYRLKVSCRLLKDSGLSVTETALACGFNHLSYYSKTFQERFGCTPKEYRARARRTKEKPEEAAASSGVMESGDGGGGET